jgi:NitT/TauT family transport system ATP-binding protein
MASIEVRDIIKSFPITEDGKQGSLKVIDRVGLSVTDGEIVSFFGPNGCGKTTFLNIIAGLIDTDKGTVRINTNKKERARIGFIFQNYRESLYPWLNNLDNIAFPLRLHGVSKKTAKERAGDFLRDLKLDIPLGGYPYQLSGGQQQLLSIARALVFEVDVLLMDEPFGSLDYTTRYVIRDIVQEILIKTKTTTLLVSHSIDEAIYMADRLVLFSRKPMRITEDIKINFQRPRVTNLLENTDFFSVRARALKIFNEEITK